MNKPLNNKAWFLILPVFLCVAFSAILPLMTVVNYSVQDTSAPSSTCSWAWTGSARSCVMAICRTPSPVS